METAKRNEMKKVLVQQQKKCKTKKKRKPSDHEVSKQQYLTREVKSSQQAHNVLGTYHEGLLKGRTSETHRGSSRSSQETHTKIDELMKKWF